MFLDLVAAVPGARLVDPGVSAQALVRSLSSNSRAIGPGGLFIALRGAQHDGHCYIPQAIQQGAAAVVGEDESYMAGLGVPAAVVPNAREAMGLLASAFYGYPSRKMGVVGITGTDGKTTTTHLIASLLQGAGLMTGLLSTVAMRIADHTLRNETPFTTPESLEVQRRLAEMASAGCRYVSLEVSSHAIATHRVAGCAFDAAVFTNLTPEHLDYHKTVEEYFETKAQLFDWVAQGPDKGVPRSAIVNADDRWGRELARRARAPLLTYGIDAAADVSARDVRISRQGTRFTLVTPSGSAEISTELVGRHNVYNWLGAMTLALSQGVELPLIAEVARRTPPVSGRLQWVECGQPFAVLVDFAHTPNALKQTILFLKSWTPGRVIAVFGHAGGRDLYNRSEMGRVAAELADYFVIATDDPGDEDPAEICRVIAQAATEARGVEGRDFDIVLDRREAFAHAFANARPGDTVLLAGRGHERHMALAKGHSIPFMDAEVAEELLAGYREHQ